MPSTRPGHVKCDQTLTVKKPVFFPSQSMEKGTVSITINLMSIVHRGSLDTQLMPTGRQFICLCLKVNLMLGVSGLSFVAYM